MRVWIHWKSNPYGLFERTNQEGDNLGLCDTAFTTGRVYSSQEVFRDYGWNYYAARVWIRRYWNLITDYLSLTIYSGFEDNITKQRTESEREYEEAESLKNEKLRQLNAELEQTLSKVTQLADELDHKQLEESVIQFWAFFE